MIQLQDLYINFTHHVFKITYGIMSVNALYFSIKSVIVKLLNLLKIKRSNKNVKFVIEFFIPAVIALLISCTFWFIIQTCSVKFLSIFSLIFSGLAGIRWYKRPLDIARITEELRHFSGLAYFICKVIAYVPLTIIGLFIVTFCLWLFWKDFSHTLFYAHYSHVVGQAWEQVRQLCGYGSSAADLQRIKYANAWHQPYTGIKPSTWINWGAWGTPDKKK